ncbi:MAG: toxin HicA [Woeseia sp.]|nr:toxin HicA [Woeseia sp.]
MAPPITKILSAMRRNPTDVRFADLCKVCERYFGPPRRSSGSHRIYRMPWAGDPRVNIQNSRGRAKAYQVRQVLQAIERLETIRDDKNR